MFGALLAQQRVLAFVPDQGFGVAAQRVQRFGQRAVAVGQAALHAFVVGVGARQSLAPGDGGLPLQHAGIDLAVAQQRVGQVALGQGHPALPARALRRDVQQPLRHPVALALCRQRGWKFAADALEFGQLVQQRGVLRQHLGVVGVALRQRGHLCLQLLDRRAGLPVAAQALVERPVPHRGQVAPRFHRTQLCLHVVGRGGGQRRGVPRGFAVVPLSVLQQALAAGQVAQARVAGSQAGQVDGVAGRQQRGLFAQRQGLVLAHAGIFGAAQVGLHVVALDVAHTLVGLGHVTQQRGIGQAFRRQAVEVLQRGGHQLLAARRGAIAQRGVDVEEHGARELPHLVETALGQHPLLLRQPGLPQRGRGATQHCHQRQARGRHAGFVALDKARQQVARAGRPRADRVARQVALHVGGQRIHAGIAPRGLLGQRLQQDVVEVAFQLLSRVQPLRVYRFAG